MLCNYKVLHHVHVVTSWSGGIILWHAVNVSWNCVFFRLSERNCIEIVQRLCELKLLDVIYTTDGKEYLTPHELSKEIREELVVHAGRKYFVLKLYLFYFCTRQSVHIFWHCHSHGLCSVIERIKWQNIIVLKLFIN